MRKRERAAPPSLEPSEEPPARRSGTIQSLMSHSIDRSDDNSQQASASVPMSAAMLSDDSNPMPLDLPQGESKSGRQEHSQTSLAAQLRRLHGYVCSQWWGRCLFRLALQMPLGPRTWEEEVAASSCGDADAKAEAVLPLVSSTAAELNRLCQAAAGDQPAFRRRALRLLLSEGFYHEKFVAVLSAVERPGGDSLHERASHGPSYRPRKQHTSTVPAPPDAAQIQRAGKCVVVEIPHHRQPALINTALMCVEPKKKKPLLDDSRIVSHPQRATLHGMEDLMIEETLHYAGLLDLRRHLQKHKCLRGLPTFLNATVYFLLGKDDEVFEKLLSKKRRNPAAVQYLSRIPSAIRLEQLLDERIRVIEQTRKSIREAALSLSLLATRAHWRDACLATVKKFSAQHISEWCSLGEVYGGVVCSFPNHASWKRSQYLRPLVANYGTPEVLAAMDCVILPMLLGVQELPSSLPLSSLPIRVAEGPTQAAASTCSIFIVPPAVLFALQGLAALFSLLRLGALLHPDGEAFLRKFMQRVDVVDDVQHIAWLMEDSICSRNSDLAQLGAVGQAVRTAVQLVESIVTDERDATVVTLRCHSEHGKDTAKLRRSMIAAFEADEALSDQVLVELVVSQEETCVRPVRLWDD